MKSLRCPLFHGPGQGSGPGARTTNEQIEGIEGRGPPVHGRGTLAYGWSEEMKPPPGGRPVAEPQEMKPPRAAVALRVIIHSAHLPLSVGNPQIPGSLLQGLGEPMRSQISRNITGSRR